MADTPALDAETVRNALQNVLSQPQFLAQISSCLLTASSAASATPVAITPPAIRSVGNSLVPPPAFIQPQPVSATLTSPAASAQSTSNVTPTLPAQSAIHFPGSSLLQQPSGSKARSAVTNLNLALSTAFKKRKLEQERKANSPRPIIFQSKLVLLSKSDCYEPINKGDELYLGRKKRFAEGVKFNRIDSNHEIKEKIYAAFSEKLNKFNQFTILVKSGATLRPLFVPQENDINGDFLYNMKSNVLYIQPEVDLDDESSSDEDILPRKVITSKKNPSDENSLGSDEDVFVPKASSSKASSSKTRKCVTSSKTLDNTTDLSDDEIIVTRPDGTSIFIDRFGMEHELTDANSTKKISTATESVQSIITECKRNISARRFYLTVRRSHAYEDVSNGICTSDFTLAKTPCFTFSNEPGVGSGVTREVLSVALKQMKGCTLLEGSEFCKTFKFASRSLHNGEYKRMGQIIALSLLHGGPAPSFFCPVIFELIIYGEAKSPLEVSHIHNERVEYELGEVMRATNLKQINEKMAESSLFETAGTVTQLQTAEERDTVVQDVLRFHCIDRIALPVAALKEGLNEATTKLLSQLQANPSECVKLFCYQNELITAQGILNLFEVSETDKRSQTYEYWRNYLTSVEGGNRPVKLEDILFFALGVHEIPPLGFSDLRPKITLRDQYLANAKSCFRELYLPSQAADEEAFFVALDISIGNKDFLGCS